MSRYFTNVKNNIEERVNTSYIDELYTKDAQGEFRKIIAGESEGTDIELPTYLKEETIEFEADATGVNSVITKGPLSHTRVTSSALIAASGTNTSGNNNQSRLILDGVRIYGPGTSNSTYYKQNEIQHISPDETRSLNLPNIADAQTNYLKPDKIEFNTSAVGVDTIISKAPGMYTKMTSSALIAGLGANTSSITNQTRLIRDGIRIYGSSETLGAYYKENEIRYINGDDTKSFTIVDAEKVVNELKDVDYLKPDKIEFADGSGLSQGLLHYVDDDSTVKSKSIKDIANSGGTTLPNYIGPYRIEFDGGLVNTTALTARGSISLAKILSNEISVELDDDSAPTESKTGIQYDGVYISSTSPSVYTTYRQEAIRLTSPTLTRSIYLADIADVVSKLKSAANSDLTGGNIRNALLKAHEITSTSTQINATLNKLNGISSSAAQIDAAVAASGGTGNVYPYLQDNSIEIDATTAATDAMIINSATASSIVRPNGIIVKTDKNSSDNVNSTQQTRNSFIVYGDTMNRNASLQHDSIRVNDGTGVKMIFLMNLYNAQQIYMGPTRIEFIDGSGLSQGLLHYVDDLSALKSVPIKDIVNSGYRKSSTWNNRGSDKIFWIGKLTPSLVTSYGFPIANIIQFTSAAVTGRRKFVFRMHYHESPAYAAGDIIPFIFRVIRGSSTELAYKYAMITANICDVPHFNSVAEYPGPLVEVIGVGPAVAGDTNNPGTGEVASVYTDNQFAAYYAVRVRTLKEIPANELIFTMMLQFHGYYGDFDAVPTTMIDP